MDDWLECTLGDFITLRRGYDLPKQNRCEGIYPVLSSSGVSGFHNEYMVQSDGVVTGRYGTIGEVFYCIGPHWPLNTTLYVDDFRGNSKKFVYYFMKTLNWKSFSIASAVPGINRNHVHRLPVRVPPLSTQHTIAAILSALDDKIDNNNRINRHLEQIAQGIFKSWFLDVSPQMVRLGSVCQCILGGTPSRSRVDFWDGNIPWINSGKVNEYRIINPSEWITDLGLINSATKLLPKKTTVIAITGATLGQVSLLEIDSCANQSVVGVVPNEEFPYTFIYPFVKDNIEKLLIHKTGGAQQHINKQNIENIDFPRYPQKTIDDYDIVVRPVLDLIALNCFVSEKLSYIRDTLLPRLLSGELSVSDLPDIS